MKLDHIELSRLSAEYKRAGSTVPDNRAWGSWPNIPSITFTVKLYDMLTAEHGAIIIGLIPSTFVPQHATPQLPPWL